MNMRDQIAADYDKLKQREQKEREAEYRAGQKKKAIATRRCIIIGEIFLRYFPQALAHQPHLTEAENFIEFAPVENFLAGISSDLDSTTLGHKGASDMGLVD